MSKDLAGYNRDVDDLKKEILGATGITALSRDLKLEKSK
jgi:hypothetical protein